MDTQSQPAGRQARLFSRLVQSFGLLILVISLVSLLWGVLPIEDQLRTLTILPAGMQLPGSPNTGAAPLPAKLETRQMTLSWPAVMRVGDPENIRLELAVVGQEQHGDRLPMADLFETHNVVAEAYLELAGVRMVPDGRIGEPLRPGHAATFLWSVRPAAAGAYPGAVWLHLRFVPLDGSPESRQPLSNQRIEIRATSPFGLTGSAARLLGGTGLLFSAVLLFKNHLPRLWGGLNKRDLKQAGSLNKRDL